MFCFERLGAGQGQPRQQCRDLGGYGAGRVRSALSCLPYPRPRFLPEDGGQVMTIFVQKPPSPAITVGFNIMSPHTHPGPGHICGIGGKALL